MEQLLIKNILLSKAELIEKVTDIEPFIKSLIVCLSDFVKSEYLQWKSASMPQDLQPADNKNFIGSLKSMCRHCSHCFDEINAINDRKIAILEEKLALEKSEDLMLKSQTTFEMPLQQAVKSNFIDDLEWELQCLTNKPEKIQHLQDHLICEIQKTLKDGIKQLKKLNLMPTLDLQNITLSDSFCRPGLAFKGIDVVTNFPSSSQLKKIQTGPKRHQQTLQLNGVLKANGWTLFNFSLSNGLRTEFHNKHPTDVEEVLNSNDKVIKTIRVLYLNETKQDAGGCLVDLAFYDKDKNLLLKTYSFDSSKKDLLVGEHVVTLNDDQRVIGFVSRQSETQPGYHFDIRFQLAQLI